MFNPKQALERIRKQKVQQQEQQQSDSFKNTLNDQPLFPETTVYQREQPVNSNNFNNDSIYSYKTKPNNVRFQQPSNNTQTLEDRMARLESLVSSLSEKLTESNQTITKLKQENDSLQAQVLKLSHENSQLKTNRSDSKTHLTHKLSTSLNSFPQNNRVITSLNSDKNHIKKAESKVIQDEVFSPEVDDVMEGIKRQPIENILKRKQQNFRALKNVTKQTLAKGQKALRQLANLHKQYGKNFKKPTLILNLEDADFQ